MHSSMQGRASPLGERSGPTEQVLLPSDPAGLEHDRSHDRLQGRGSLHLAFHVTQGTEETPHLTQGCAHVKATANS